MTTLMPCQSLFRAQMFVKNVADLVKVGDKMKIKVLNLDVESGKIALTMKGVTQGEQSMRFLDSDGQQQWCIQAPDCTIVCVVSLCFDTGLSRACTLFKFPKAFCTDLGSKHTFFNPKQINHIPANFSMGRSVWPNQTAD